MEQPCSSLVLLLSWVEQVVPSQLLCCASGWSCLISDASLASPVQWLLWFCVWVERCESVVERKSLVVCVLGLERGADRTTLALQLDIAISCMCATSPPTVVTPPSNLIGQASLCPHSPSTPRSGSKIHIQRAGTSVAPSSGSEHAVRIACSCPVDVEAGANAAPFALCRIFQNCHSAVDSDILSSFFPSLIFFRPHSLRSEGKGRWYTLYNAVRTTCRTPPLQKMASARK